MNSILTGNSSNLEKSASASKSSNKDVETAGSLALAPTPIFSMSSGGGYDMFIPSNPFSLNINCGYVNIDPSEGMASHDTYVQNLNIAMNFAQTSSFDGGFGGASTGFTGTAVSSCSAGGGFLC